MADGVTAARSGAARWLGFLLMALALVVEGFDLQAANFASPSVVERLHVEKALMGPFQSASLFGLLFGALFIAPLGDRHGRRAVIILSCATYGLLSLVAAMASNLTELIALRFLIGIGLGGVLPNALALAGEFAPEKLLASAAGLVGIGITFGGVVAGLTAARLLPVYGWPGLFVAGGILPLVIAALLWMALPESPALERGVRREKAGHVGQLFADGRSGETVAIWLAFALVLMVAYLLTGWIPLIIKDQGYSTQTATLIATAGQAGGVLGGIVASLALSKRQWPVVALFASIAALLMLLIASQAWNVTMLTVLIACQGFFSVGTQNGLNGSAGATYPADMRSLGLGWALGMGRVGSIVGPLAGSAVVIAGLGTPRHFFFIPVIPLFVAALLALYLSRTAKIPKESPQ